MNRRDFLVGAAALPIALRLAPEALGRLTGGTPLALVTADTESHVAAVQLATGRIAHRIRTLPGPRSIESLAGRFAVVAHTKLGAVSLLDGSSLEVRHVLRDFSEPRYTAAHPDGRHAFVTDSRRGEVVSVDVPRGRVLGRAQLGGPARHVSMAENGRLLWVSLGSKADRVAIVDVSQIARPRLLHRIEPPFLAHDVGFAPGGRRVWMSSGDQRSLAVYEAGTGRVLRRLPADAPPQHITFIGGRAYVTSGEDGTLHVHSLASGRLLRRTTVPAGSYNVQQGFGEVLTPSLDRGTLCVLNAAGRLRRRVQVAPSSHDACFVISV